MTKTPIKTSEDTGDSFLLKMKEFYQAKEQREKSKSRNSQRSRPSNQETR